MSIQRRRKGEKVPRGWSLTDPPAPSENAFPRVHLNYRRKLEDGRELFLHVCIPANRVVKNISYLTADEEVVATGER